jgi:hypothetical protein
VRWCVVEIPGVIAGEPDVAGQLTAGAATHWYVPEGMSAEEVFADYRAAIARADAVLAAATPEQEPAARPVRSGRPDGCPTYGTP